LSALLWLIVASLKEPLVISVIPVTGRRPASARPWLSTHGRMSI